MKNVFNKTLLASALMLGAGYASAASFQLAEVSTVGLGRAYAGEAAIGDNASVVATNPALMTRFDRNQFSAGGVLVDSHVHMYGDVTTKLNGATLAQEDAGHRKVIPRALVPNMYFVAPINDKFVLGGGMNVNFGLKSEYEDDYAGGVFGGKTDLTALNLNFSGAYKITEGLSAGLGLNAIYAKAKIERRAGVLDTALTRAAAVAAATGSPRAPLLAGLSQMVERDTVLTRLEDKAAWAFGWNAGLSYAFNENHRIGLAYHSKVDIDFKDNHPLTYRAGVVNGQMGLVVPDMSGGLTLKLPDYWEFSGYHKLTDKFAMHYSYKYTRWSRLQNLHATYSDGSTAFHKDENYKNVSRYAVGATYELNDDWTLRTGVAYDKSAAPSEHASASIPDTDRKWFSLGATYKVNSDMNVDFGFTHIRGKKLHFSEKQTIANLISVEGEYSSRATVNLYGINFNYSF